MLQTGLFASGTGIILLVRGTPGDRFFAAGFLLDVFCLGVKDSFSHGGLTGREVDMLVAATEEAAPLEPIEPAYARKLLHEAVAYGRANGIEPPEDYAALEAAFGDVVADAGDVTFTFGYEGKPLYIPSSEETPVHIRRRIASLTEALGEDGYAIDLSWGEEEDDALDSALLYDPDTDPDPSEWLAADEGERIAWVEAYHEMFEEAAETEHADRAGAHAALHVGIENQLAANNPPAARRALERLLAEGLDRHDAVHAMASVLLNEWIASAREERGEAYNDAYVAALDALTFESWRVQTSEDD